VEVDPGAIVSHCLFSVSKVSACVSISSFLILHSWLICFTIFSSFVSTSYHWTLWWWGLSEFERIEDDRIHCLLAMKLINKRLARFNGITRICGWQWSDALASRRTAEQTAVYGVLERRPHPRIWVVRAYAEPGLWRYSGLIFWMRGRVVFGEIIGTIGFARCPVEIELFAERFDLSMMIAHVRCFWISYVPERRMPVAVELSVSRGASERFTGGPFLEQ
jgi:hypothetical protein